MISSPTIRMRVIPVRPVSSIMMISQPIRKEYHRNTYSAGKEETEDSISPKIGLLSMPM